VIVIPAIDLHKGKVVRLKKGDFNEVTIYSDSVASIAKSFEDAGAKRIHVVDLDGSLEGKRINAESIMAICSAVKCEVELGGGIRSVIDVQEAFSLGVKFVILGTVIINNPEAAKEILVKYPGRAALGIDARDGKVATAGWTETSTKRALDVAIEYEALKPAFIVYTDISRDGMLTGPNIEATAAIAGAVKTPVVASGGVSSLEDLIELNKIDGLFGAITGKAIYEGRLDLKQALKLIG
jgi:phosphoribosylformimino-5-aminoimidazole carboxamide ribotide isomerase